VRATNNIDSRKGVPENDGCKGERWDQIDEVDLKLLRAAQDGLQLTAQPYQTLGTLVGLSEEEVLARLRLLLETGVVRRVAATIGHRALGIVANAMIVWRVPEEKLEDAGRTVASFEEVTHCYERESTPDWPYNLYAMVHSKSRMECERIAAEISKTSGYQDYRILFSEREYKKTSARI